MLTTFNSQTTSIEQYSFDKNITKEWAWGGSTGRGVKVAILDSGVDATHPVLNNNVQSYLNINIQGSLPTMNTTPHSDTAGHGTACAGIIRSIAPDCEIYSIKILDDDLAGKGTALVSGLQWALDQGVDVCNLSLGTTKRQFFLDLYRLADLAYFRNTILVAAANNWGLVSSPANFASVISVVAHSEPDPYSFKYLGKPQAEFSAYGQKVQVAWLNQAWTTMTGNSFAAPHITGIVSLIKSKHPKLNLFQIKTILQHLASN